MDPLPERDAQAAWVLDGMAVGHVVVDSSWTLVHANHAAERMEALAETAVRLAHLPRHEL